MSYTPRHDKILCLLGQEGSIAVGELAARMGVSVETIRRDIKIMAARGDLVRTHGAVGLPSVLSEAPFERRMRVNFQAKEAIAALVAASIQDGESIMLDTGTTTSILARALLKHRRLTVITNSSDIARTLATVNGNKVYMAGGELRSDSGAALGHSAIEFVSRFAVDHAIISAGGINSTKGIVDYDLQEAQFGNTVLNHGRRRVVVADAAKFGQQGLVQVCELALVDELFTDRAPPEELASALRGAEVKLRTSQS